MSSALEMLQSLLAALEAGDKEAYVAAMGALYRLGYPIPAGWEDPRWQDREIFPQGLTVRPLGTPDPPAKWVTTSDEAVIQSVRVAVARERAGAAPIPRIDKPQVKLERMTETEEKAVDALIAYEASCRQYPGRKAKWHREQIAANFKSRYGKPPSDRTVQAWLEQARDIKNNCN